MNSKAVRTSISTAGPMVLNLCVLSSNWRLFRRYFCSTNLVQHDGAEVTCSGAKFPFLGPSWLEGGNDHFQRRNFQVLRQHCWTRGLGLGAGILRGEKSRFLHCETFSFTLGKHCHSHCKASVDWLRLNTDDGAACKTWELSCYFSWDK